MPAIRITTTTTAALALLALSLLVHLALMIDGEQVAGLEDVRQHCAKKLSKFTSIAQFRSFVSRFAEVRKEIETLGDAEKKAQLVRCLEEWPAIEAFDALLASYNKDRPCKLSEIDKLEQYAKQYLLNKKALTMKFFTLFGVQIGLACKLNLLAHLKQADMEADQIDFIYSIASPTGWNVLINEYTKKSLKFGGSTHQESNIINKVAKLVPGLTQIEHLDFLNFNHSMNEYSKEDWSGIESGSYNFSDTIDKKIRTKVHESLLKITGACKNLDQFYVNSILSLAKLKELGLLFDYLTNLHEQSATLHKWLAAASFCQTMIRVRVNTEPGSDPIKFEVVHNDDLLESRRQLYSYVAKFEDISQTALDEAWRASVSEGDWRRKSEAMFVFGTELSVAKRQLKQFIRGLERSFKDADEASE